MNTYTFLACTKGCVQPPLIEGADEWADFSLDLLCSPSGFAVKAIVTPEVILNIKELGGMADSECVCVY